MKVSLDVFKQKVDDIKSHNACFVSLYKIMADVRDIKTDANLFLNNYTKERGFNFRANVITLYGIFEQFVEDSIREYVDELSRLVSSFDLLNDKIKKEYVEKWKGLHGKLNYAKFSNIEENRMIETLYETVVKNNNQILAECFLLNGGNYKHECISNMLINLGLNDYKSCIAKYPPLKDYFGGGSHIDYNKLDELVDCRNEIAHGANYENIWSIEMFLSYLDFLVVYGETLTNYLNDKLLQEYWNKYSIGKVIKPYNYYTANKVFEFHLKDLLLFGQQKIVIKQSKNHYPQYLEYKMPEIYCKRPEESKDMIKKVDVLYGDGEWYVSIKIPLNLNINSKFIFEPL